MAEIKIKRKSWLWNLVPLAGRNRFSNAIGTTIYLTPKRYDDYKSGSPKTSTIALIEHEKVHVRQSQEDKGFRRKYIFSRNARLNYELEAYAVQLKILAQHRPSRKEKYIQQKAKTLSSNYLLFMDYDDIHRKMKAEVEKVIAAG
jgi:hypothetical protein